MDASSVRVVPAVAMDGGGEDQGVPRKTRGRNGGPSARRLEGWRGDSTDWTPHMCPRQNGCAPRSTSRNIPRR